MGGFMKKGDKILWRWKRKEPTSFIEGFVLEEEGNFICISSYYWSCRGDWVKVDEIDWAVLARKQEE